MDLPSDALEQRTREIKKRTLESDNPLYKSPKLLNMISKIENEMGGKVVKKNKDKPDTIYNLADILEQIDGFDNGNGYRSITRGNEVVEVRRTVLEALTEVSSQLIDDNGQKIFNIVKGNKSGPEASSYFVFDEMGEVQSEPADRLSVAGTNMQIIDETRVGEMRITKERSAVRVQELIFKTDKISNDFSKSSPDLTKAQFIARASVNKANQKIRLIAGGVFNSQPVVRMRTSDDKLILVR